MPENELLKKMEKEVLDFYISNHPLAIYNSILKTFTIPLGETQSPESDGDVVVGGLVKKNVKRIITKKKKGDKMAFVNLEDMDSEVEVVVFPRTFDTYQRHLENDKIVIIAGKIDKKEDSSVIIADKIFDVTEAMEMLTKHVTVNLSSVGMTSEMISKIKTLIGTHHGDVPVRLRLERPKAFAAYIQTGQDFCIKPGYDFFNEIDNLLGKDRYEIVSKPYVHEERKKRYQNNKSA